MRVALGTILAVYTIGKKEKERTEQDYLSGLAFLEPNLLVFSMKFPMAFQILGCLGIESRVGGKLIFSAAEASLKLFLWCTKIGQENRK